MAIVEAKVKRERVKKSKEVAAAPWWQFWRGRRELFAAITGLERVLVILRVGNAFAFCEMDAKTVFSERLVVFPYSTNKGFTLLQSRIHEVWARFFSSTLKDDLMYAPSDCFETFPFPEEWGTHPALESAGQAYYDHRAPLMVKNNEGLTKTYNRFHNPLERDPGIQELRRLHAAMDRAVLQAYGWDDLAAAAEAVFLNEDNEPYYAYRGRLFWPSDFRDQVLARLLDLIRARAAAEAAIPPKRAGATRRRKSSAAGAARNPGPGLE